MNPFMNFTKLTDSQLYANLLTINDRMQSVHIYGMNPSIISQLESQRESIEFELEERRSKPIVHKKKTRRDEPKTSQPERGTVWSMDSYRVDNNNNK